MKHTVREIAKLAGTSPSSVSLVLNGKPGVRKEMRKKIEKILIENGYEIKGNVPDKMIRIFFVYYRSSNWILRRKDNFFARIIDGIESACHRLNCELTMVHANSQNVDEVLRSVTKERADGVVFLATEYSHSPERISKNLSVPFVCIDRYFEEEQFEIINIANYQSHYLTIRHLMELGHRNIGYLSTKVETGALKNRREEFYRVMKKFNLDFSDKFVLYLGFLQDEAECELEQYIREVENLPTAFVACNDVIAVAAMKTLQRLGWKVPEDVSIVGFDNSGICDMVNPGLTTIHADLERMGALAVERIVQMIETEEESRLSITIGTKLICRETTARVKRTT